MMVFLLHKCLFFVSWRLIVAVLGVLVGWLWWLSPVAIVQGWAYLLLSQLGLTVGKCLVLYSLISGIMKVRNTAILCSVEGRMVDNY